MRTEVELMLLRLDRVDVSKSLESWYRVPEPSIGIYVKDSIVIKVGVEGRKVRYSITIVLLPAIWCGGAVNYEVCPHCVEHVVDTTGRVVGSVCLLEELDQGTCCSFDPIVGQLCICIASPHLQVQLPCPPQP